MRSDGAGFETLLSRSDQVHAVSASFMGWTLDAFDFFVLVFLVDTLAVQFHVPASKIILTITATLAMRPLGALVLGLLATVMGGAGRSWPMWSSFRCSSCCAASPPTTPCS